MYHVIIRHYSSRDVSLVAKFNEFIKVECPQVLAQCKADLLAVLMRVKLKQVVQGFLILHEDSLDLQSFKELINLRPLFLLELKLIFV
jgi:hypothetical protein